MRGYILLLQGWMLSCWMHCLLLLLVLWCMHCLLLWNCLLLLLLLLFLWCMHCVLLPLWWMQSLQLWNCRWMHCLLLWNCLLLRGTGRDGGRHCRGSTGWPCWNLGCMHGGMLLLDRGVGWPR